MWALISARQHNGLEMTEEIQAQINGMDETDVIPNRPYGNYWKWARRYNGYQKRWIRADEDITPSDVPANPPTVMQGPMTRARMRQLNLGELVLKRSFSYF